MKEEWKKIPKFNYEVSTLGKVRNKNTGRVLKPIKITQKSGNYYAYSVRLYKNSKSKQFYIHILVCEAFIGPRPKGMQVRHLDGNHDNCSIKNLKWGTVKENNDDKKTHGTRCFGINHGISKLCDEDVVKIKKLHKKNTYTYKEIGSRFGVSAKTIGNIINGKVWTHVP